MTFGRRSSRCSTASIRQPGQAVRGPTCGSCSMESSTACARVASGVIDRIGCPSTVHGWFQRFAADGFLEEIWAYLVRECEELGAVRWEWQAADGVMGKSRFEGAKRGPNPTDRAKMGTKKSVLVDQEGGPPAAVIDGANTHDTKLLAETINAVVIPRPDPAMIVQNLCLDKGYDNPTGEAACAKGGYVAHIRRIGEEKKDGWGEKTHPARRWVVERVRHEALLNREEVGGLFLWAVAAAR